MRYLDFSAIVALLICFSMFWTWLGKGHHNVAIDNTLIYLHLIYGILMLVTLLWTTAPHYGLSKTLRFNIFSFVALVGPMILIKTRHQVERMNQWLILLGAIIAVIILISPSYQYLHEASYWEIRQTAFGSNPLNPAFVIAVASVLAITSIRQAKPWFRLFSLASVPFMLWAIYRTGSRAMFFQVFLGIIIWICSARTKIRWIYLIILAVLIIQGPLLFELFSHGSHTNRISEAFIKPGNAIISSDRMVLWRYVLDNASSNVIFGHGVGSFAMDYYGQDRRKFPHNLFLEALYEQGILGFIVLTVFLGLAFFRYLRLYMKKETTAIQDTWFAVSLSALASIMFHWDLADIRLLWFCIGLLASQCLTKYKCTSSHSYSLPNSNAANSQQPEI